MRIIENYISYWAHLSHSCVVLEGKSVQSEHTILHFFLFYSLSRPKYYIFIHIYIYISFSFKLLHVRASLKGTLLLSNGEMIKNDQNDQRKRTKFLSIGGLLNLSRYRIKHKIKVSFDKESVPLRLVS